MFKHFGVQSFQPVFLLAFCLLTGNCLGQDLTVLATISAEGKSQHYHMSYTVGESVVWTGGSTQIIVIQGFQQPDYKGTVSTPKTDVISWELSLFPNPAHSHLDFHYQLPPDEYLNFQVYDADGRLLVGPRPLPEGGFYSLDVSNLIAGPYTVHFSDDLGKQTARQFLLLR